MKRITLIALSSALLLALVVAVRPERHDVEGRKPLVMVAREAHARALAGELVLVDIRSPDEWRKTGVPASAYAITMHQDQVTFMRQLAEATGTLHQKPSALICATGNRSALIQGRLKQAGLENVIDVAEGVMGGPRGTGWINSGLPLRRWTPGLERPRAASN